jgi:predicted nucleotidyltransferase
MGQQNSGAVGKLKITTEDPDLAVRFNSVLGDVVEALEETSIRYAFIGGIASGGLGRPRSTHDIDLFVPPEDAELTLRALTRRGFKTEKTDPSWLYKAFKNNILVDVIFRSKGEIYLDQEMHARSITGEFHGRPLRLVAPEDLLIIKAAAHNELCPNHWHDATALLSHASLDWGYLIKRAKRAPRRVLSLLLYAQSNDIWVPNHVIHELFNGVFGDVYRSEVDRGLPRAPRNLLRPVQQSTAPFSGRRGVTPTEYALSHLRQCLAEDIRTNELDIQIEQAGDRVLLRGEVTANDRRDAVAQIARECFPNAIVENQIRVLDVSEPAEGETMT